MNLKKYAIAVVAAIGFYSINSNLVAKSENEDIRSNKEKLQCLMRDYRLPPIREFNVHLNERNDDLSEEQRRARRMLVELGQDEQEDEIQNTELATVQFIDEFHLHNLPAPRDFGRSLEILALLNSTEQGARVNNPQMRRHNEGQTPLELALSLQNYEVAGLLIDHWVRFNTQRSETGRFIPDAPTGNQNNRNENNNNDDDNNESNATGYFDLDFD